MKMSHNAKYYLKKLTKRDSRGLPKVTEYFNKAKDTSNCEAEKPPSSPEVELSEIATRPTEVTAASAGNDITETESGPPMDTCSTTSSTSNTVTVEKSSDVGWTLGLRSRWASHGDMVKQYAHCIEERLAAYNITNIQLTFDVWMSLNKRFQQRMFDPNVDILTADWSPFSEVTFIKPLLVDLSDWRGKLSEIQRNLHDSTNYTDLVFVADFPGLHLENYIQSDLGNTTITLLKGEVIVEIMEKNTNFSLKEGDMVQVPSETFHKVHTVSSTPSCYMYIYVNVTKEEFYNKLSLYQQALNASHNGSDPESLLLKGFEKDPHLSEYQKHLEKEEASKQVKQRSTLDSFTRFLSRKYRLFNRSAMFVVGALKSILFNEPFDEFVAYRNMIDNQSKMKESVLLHTSP